ncbi:MAG: ChbG/HpnK family deacetylase [Lachnospiraceae bacterium]|nr:ChbG/HpnK family deacetylase [Lachnospiraceae bacterium]
MIEIHADDYALTVRTSLDIIALMKEGVLDGISIVCNTSCFDDCMARLEEAIPSLPFLPKMSVHLNLVEGLVLGGEDGQITGSTWKSLFYASFNPIKRISVKRKVKKQIEEQLKCGWQAISMCRLIAKDNGIPCSQEKLRIDSHQHTHVIPVVWSALTEVIRENGYEVEYIRSPKEPLRPFVRAHSLWKTYSFINLIKNRLLFVLSSRSDRLDKKEGRTPMYLWGLMMSGRMDAKRIAKLFPSVKKYAAGDKRNLEILFHPGRMGEHELTDEIPKISAEMFYLSTNRDMEKAGARKCRALTDRAVR